MMVKMNDQGRPPDDDDDADDAADDDADDADAGDGDGDDDGDGDGDDQKRWSKAMMKDDGTVMTQWYNEIAVKVF